MLTEQFCAHACTWQMQALSGCRDADDRRLTCAHLHRATGVGSACEHGGRRELAPRVGPIAPTPAFPFHLSQACSPYAGM